MPYRKKYTKKRTTRTKRGHVKGKGKKPKQPSKMSWKQLIRKTPEQYTDLLRLKALFTPMRFNYFQAIVGGAVNAYAGDYTWANDIFDPSRAVGARQPYLYDQIAPLFSYVSVKRMQVVVDYIDTSTINTVPYYVWVMAVNTQTGATNPVLTAEDLLERRDRTVKPAFTLVQSGATVTAGGKRRLKLKFDLCKVAAITPAQYEADAGVITSGGSAYAHVTGGGPAAPIYLWHGIVSQDGTALPVTVGGNFTMRQRTLIKFWAPKDMGTS